MRLDHLLSKEHAGSLALRGGSGPGPLPGRAFRGGCSRVEHRLVGWFVHVVLVLLVFGWGWNVVGVSGRLGTLLGPEGTGVRSFLLRAASSVEPLVLCAVWLCVGWWGG